MAPTKGPIPPGINGVTFKSIIRILCILSVRASVPDRTTTTECGAVFLTVSSLWSTNPGKTPYKGTDLEMNWVLSCENSSQWAIPNWVGLFFQDPRSDLNITPAVRVNINEYPSGYYHTNVTFEKPLFPGGWDKDFLNNEQTPTVIPGPHCLPYWIASYNNNTLLKSNCLKIEPTWMYDHKMQIGHVPINSLFIPGTHNSGCYHRGSAMKRSYLFQRYLLTQDRDIWSQLVFGIRYIDVRVGYYSSSSGNETSRFWINHDLIKVAPLVSFLNDIRRFLEFAKGEVIILDFHRFPVGFNSRPIRHKKLATLLENELGNLTLNFKKHPNRLSPTLNEIWAQDRRLIIAYGDKNTSQEYDWLWGPLQQFWGDQDTPSGLKTYIQKIVTSSHYPKNSDTNPLWATMAHLTPSPLNVILQSGSNREMADSVNRNLTSWFRTKWGQSSNIVATDFFLGNNLIEVAIDTNVKKTNT